MEGHDVVFNTHEEIYALHAHQLREVIKEEVNKDKPRRLTIGLLLWRMKKEKLFRIWGYEKVSYYYLQELHIPVSRAEVWVAYARRCLSHELSYSDMRTVETLVTQYQRLGRLTRFAKNKKQLMEGARKLAAGLPFGQLTRYLGSHKTKPIRAFDIGHRALDYETVHLVNNWLKKKIKRPGHSLLIPFLVVKALHESKPGKRHGYFRRLLLRHGVPEEQVPVIFREGE